MTELLLRHVDREWRGEVWRRLRRRRRVTRGLVRRTERFARYDALRAASARPAFEPIDGHEHRLSQPPERPAGLPADFLSRLTARLTERERVLLWLGVLGDEQKQAALALGLSEGRVSQLMTPLLGKLIATMEQCWPGIWRELR